MLGMSKLDDILTPYTVSCFTEIDVDKQELFKDQIKTLMLGLVGFNSSLDDNEVLKFKKELKKNINEL